MTRNINATSNNLQVREFYEDMPFSYYSSVDEAARNIAANPVTAYPDLDALLQDDDIKTVLEIGCGAGWAANSIALHYGKQVTAVDFTSKALERAKEVSQKIGTRGQIRFVHSDLFEFQTDEKFDLVLSVGVLHHTNDCHAAFRHISRFCAADGLLFIGLYHSYGRLPFLKHFHEIVKEQGEEAAFRRYCQINPGQSDTTHMRSWFRDQVLHPQETQHSLAEVMVWLDQAGFGLLTTSINKFEQVTDRTALIELEKACEAYSEQRNIAENQFFPGFFTVLAERL